MMGTNGFRQKCVTKEQKLKKIKEKKSEKKKRQQKRKLLKGEEVEKKRQT